MTTPTSPAARTGPRHDPMIDAPPPPPGAQRVDLLRIVLGVVFAGALIVGSLWVLRPFLGPLVWATLIVTATWPVMLRVQSMLWGRRALAAAVMSLLLLLVVIVPLTMAVVGVVEGQDRVVALARQLAAMDLRTPPAWVAQLPWIGERAAATWASVAATPVADLLAQVTPYLPDAAKWLLAQAGTVGTLLVQLGLILVLAAILYLGGDTAARQLLRFGWRLSGERGMNVVVLAGQAIRGVALGVVVTALLQSMLGGIGLAIAGVPAAGLLTGVMLVLCIAQLGPLLVLLPATGWLFYSGDTAWGAFLLVWTLVVGTMDNVVRPVLIKRGADLPLLLILAGVIGGLLAFGLIGIFIGPVLLAVSYTLLGAWIDDGDDPPASRADALLRD